MLTIKRQEGAALLTALAFLVIITLVSVTAIRSSTSELRLANNYEVDVTAGQVAQAAIDYTMSNENNFIVTGTEGTKKTVDLTNAITEVKTATTVELTELSTMQPPRGTGVSADKFQTTLFNIRGAYDNVAAGKGQRELHQGFLLLIPKS